jgi:hypothetical protein
MDMGEDVSPLRATLTTTFRYKPGKGHAGDGQRLNGPMSGRRRGINWRKTETSRQTR